MKKSKDMSLFPMAVFIPVFIGIAAITAIQSGILMIYIDFSVLPIQYGVLTAIYCLLVAAVFTVVTRYQIRNSFEKPMKILADASGKVANGDFSVYIKPPHTSERFDYIDQMFLDFNKMVEELGSMETLKVDFFSNVSHEIKTPLAVIHNYTDVLLTKEVAEPVRKEYLETILSSSKKLSKLITNILKLNKLEKQTLTVECEEYDLCRQLCECAVYFEEEWERRNIEFIADIEDSATIKADESLMELVWNNLLSNAIKFTPTGGTVSLKQESTEHEITVCVSDTGCGMDEKTLAHIFEKFYQGDASRTMDGNGLGLALCHRILQLMDFTIEAESVPEKGSIFLVRIPV